MNVIVVDGPPPISLGTTPPSGRANPPGFAVGLWRKSFETNPLSDPRFRSQAAGRLEVNDRPVALNIGTVASDVV